MTLGWVGLWSCHRLVWAPLGSTNQRNLDCLRRKCVCLYPSSNIKAVKDLFVIITERRIGFIRCCAKTWRYLFVLLYRPWQSMKTPSLVVCRSVIWEDISGMFQLSFLLAFNQWIPCYQEYLFSFNSVYANCCLVAKSLVSTNLSSRLLMA